jgi:pyruvate/2-oxoglutarate dehydrogenase complex dihydrolipoamide acyltransferase (E2) component
MSVVLRLLLAAALTAVAVGGGVMLFTDDDSSGHTAQATSAPLASFDTSRLTVLRTGFCDGVDDSAVEEALGAAPEQESSYANGDRVRLTEEVRDRAHEHGCVWSTGSVTAAGWVFAPPVPRATASGSEKLRDDPRRPGVRRTVGRSDLCRRARPGGLVPGFVRRRVARVQHPHCRCFRRSDPG